MDKLLYVTPRFVYDFCIWKVDNESAHLAYSLLELTSVRSGSLALRDSIARTSYGNVAGWVDDWVAVCHSRYCIKTTKPILKLFRPSGSHHLSI